MKKDKVWVVVPAAGSGRRMESDIPKQYLSLMGETVIELTLSRLQQVHDVTEITVAISEGDSFFSRLPIFNAGRDVPKITATRGGRERSDSVLAALQSLEHKATLSDWVLVHDAARCCIRVEYINAMLEQLKSSAVGGILGVPTSDTVKRVVKTQVVKKQVGNEYLVEQTLDRSKLWLAQTPQLFRYGLLKEALMSAQHNQQTITDEASAIELMGHSVQMCMGHYDNIKITHPNDLMIAEAFLKQQAAV
ncbi:MAG: 2-C-methyl-D-erythritol 4-phosphate cytidylyltransferase [Cellvibrionaceae bacterium]